MKPLYRGLHKVWGLAILCQLCSISNNPVYVTNALFDSNQFNDDEDNIKVKRSLITNKYYDQDDITI